MNSLSLKGEKSIGFTKKDEITPNTAYFKSYPPNVLLQGGETKRTGLLY
jgi:hypothetical protein